MKAIKIFTLFLLFSFINSINDADELLQTVKTNVQKIAPIRIPPGAMIQNIMGITDLIDDSFDLNNPDILAKKYKFIPAQIITKFKGLKFSKQVTDNYFEERVKQTQGRVIMGIAAARYDGKKVKYVYIQSDMHGDLKKKEVCHLEERKKKFLGITIKKWNETVCVPADYKQYEIDDIYTALESHCLSKIKSRLSSVNAKAEFIMTENFALNSLSGNSLAKLLPNGRLFIGKKTEANIYPRVSSTATYLGKIQNTSMSPFSLELSITKEMSNSNRYLIITEFDEEGNIVNKEENYYDQDEPSRNFLTIEDSESNELKESSVISFLDKSRRVYHTIKVPTGQRPYRLTVTESSVFMVSDFNWTPLYDSKMLYVNRYYVVIPQVHKFYSQNNKYYIYLSESGRLGMYQDNNKYSTTIWAIDKDDDIAGPYSLILEKNGELKVINFKNEVTWKSEVTTQATGEKSLVVTNTGKLQVVCNGNTIFSK